MKKLMFLAAAALVGVGAVQAKKALDHSDFDGWKTVRNVSLSNSGEWSAFVVNPQEGDGRLVIRSTRSQREIVLPRGYKPSFTADSRWAVAMIKPLHADTRKAKIDKKKGFDLPQDSLAIIDLKTGDVRKIARVISYKTGKDGGAGIAYLSSDTTLIKPKALNDKESGRPLIICNPATGVSRTVKWVKDYEMSRDGRRVAVTLKHHESDSTATDGVGLVTLPDTAFTLVDRDRKFYGAPVFSYAGDKLAFTASNDTVKTGTKKARLYVCDLTREIYDAEEVFVNGVTRPSPNLQPPHVDDPELQARLDADRREMLKRAAADDMYVNQYSVPEFSHDGRRIVIGIAPVIAPDDTTIVDFERADLNIWRWDAPRTPPQETKLLDKLRKHTYPVVINLADGSQQLLTTNPLAQVVAGDRWDSDWAMILDPSEEYVSRQWNYMAPQKVSVKNVDNGEERFVTAVPEDDSMLSPCGKYVLWYADNAYHAYEIATGVARKVSEGIDVPLWDEENDMPMDKRPYGLAAWVENDAAVLVYDRHDIWSLDPKGVRKAICLTDGAGRKDNLRFRYVKTDDEQRYIRKGENMVLSVFNYTDKCNGLATLRYDGRPARPSVKVAGEYQFSQFRKAKDADAFSWVRANFSTSPDIWLCNGTDFAKARRVSDINPQMKEYSWGEARLVKWYGYNGDLVEGVLYTPDGFDEAKAGEYPMLAVFYERNSEQLYRHYTMEPSWSWVNYPFYVSRGYVVFVPDVKYAAGIPGESAYNYICSGVEELCKRYPQIDAKRIGIDGQSWGGYQTAYLVTRTDMFACAGSGAPVSNMTSAFGGIRWGTGDSRQAQYEMGQSRIGRNLWEAPELYIANSPIFKADRVHTPLLIMHNDSDGAVPWYQGIEMFMALRRLHRPVWMLQYNGEEHNLIERRNRKDITIRLQQFFDHYLKGAPEPRWMREGIDPLRRGQDMATDL